jgi:DNA excision repair protein ERCC-1
MDDDDEFGADPDFLAVLAATDASSTTTRPRITQPNPQRLDPRPPATTPSAGPKVVQPTPQALPSRSSGSAIFVSHRQKGNPILANLRTQPWEWRDIPADYVMGQTTCALFLSLKYHRLHPEYIYNRIRGLQGKYNLRVLLTMVDIPNHEESLKELSKTSLINNVTVVLCWSAAEGARYLELYKSFEHAAPSAIMGAQARNYTEQFVEFVTVPRGVNKTDAVSIVSAFGSVRAAVNARPEEIAVLSGWGEKKIKRWTEVVREPFRAKKATKRGMLDEGEEQVGRERRVEAVPLSRVPLRDMDLYTKAKSPETTHNKGKENATEFQPEPLPKKPFQMLEIDSDSGDELAMIAAAMEEGERLKCRKIEEQRRKDDELSGGIAAALAKLRKE